VFLRSDRRTCIRSIALEGPQTVDIATFRLVDRRVLGIVRDVYDEVTREVSFATEWIERLIFKYYLKYNAAVHGRGLSGVKSLLVCAAFNSHRNRPSVAPIRMPWMLRISRSTVAVRIG
jgi:hypothetical protein